MLGNAYWCDGGLLALEGGPAAKNERPLYVKRTPIFLRLVRDRRATDITRGWDVLDQPDDVVGEREIAHVYEQVPHGWVIACTRARGQYSGPIVRYRHVPLESTLLRTVRDNVTWREWVIRRCQEDGIDG